MNLENETWKIISNKDNFFEMRGNKLLKRRGFGNEAKAERPSVEI